MTLNWVQHTRLVLFFSLLAPSRAWLLRPSHSRSYKDRTRTTSSRPNNYMATATTWRHQFSPLMATRLGSSNDEASSSTLGEEVNTFLVEVTYEGRSCKVPIGANETLLSGLERARVPDQLAIPELPSECRRGNCLTCAGRHTNNSEESSLRRGEDGLSPYMSRLTSKSGYVLTCSSFVTGDGLKLELGQNSRAWTDLYRDRLYDESTQYAARKAMARTIRRSDEKNLEQWAIETKTALEKSGEY